MASLNAHSEMHRMRAFHLLWTRHRSRQVGPCVLKSGQLARITGGFVSVDKKRAERCFYVSQGTTERPFDADTNVRYFCVAEDDVNLSLRKQRPLRARPSFIKPTKALSRIASQITQGCHGYQGLHMLSCCRLSRLPGGSGSI